MNIHAFADEASNSLDGQIKAMLENHIKGLEIRHVDEENIANITAEKARIIRARLDDAGLITFSIGSPIGKVNIEEDFSKEYERFCRVLENAKILGAEKIRLFSFFTPTDKDPSLYRNEVVDRLGRFTEGAKDYGVTLCHENEKGIFGSTPENCLFLHNALPEIKAIFDPANFIQCSVDSRSAWEQLRPYVEYLHIKDALPNGYVVPAGMGCGELRYIIGDYAARGGTNVTIEPHLKVFSGLSEIDKDGNTLVGEAFTYPTNEAAFAAAVSAFKEILEEIK